MNRPLNVDRQNAITFKLTTYTGSEHKCGTSQRYTSTGTCMHCARLLAAEQREALKVLRAQAKVKATSEDPVNYDHEDVLDIVEPLVAEMVDQAEADRFRQSVDDLM